MFKLTVEYHAVDGVRCQTQTFERLMVARKAFARLQGSQTVIRVTLTGPKGRNIVEWVNHAAAPF